MGLDLFQGRTMCIATMHGKEKVIAPILEEAIGVECAVPKDLNTDLFGTFSGETERTGSPLDAARRKCEMAMEITNCDLAVASEGSFGSHPTLFFVPGNEEIVLLIDRKNNLEIVARHITTYTNFGAKEIASEVELLEFAEKSNFPSHALILKDKEKNWSHIVKGINTPHALTSEYHSCIRKYGNVFIETDMRAMFNPSRMRAIEEATQKLTSKLLSTCPNCEMPGFDIVEYQSGLPCQQCSMPTKSTLNAVYRCKHCTFAQIEKFPKGKEFEDPMYCDFCNP